MIKNELGALEGFRNALPEDLKKHPSMMSPMELEILYGMTKDYYTGQGKIVDAGVFMGASTRLFGHGIMANANADAIYAKYAKPVVTLEWGQLGGGMPAFFKRHNIETEGLLDGTSFAPLLRKMIADVLPKTDLNLGDIKEFSWDDTPIEICFLDVIKSYAINAQVFQMFVPNMIPGHSILIQQDYFIDRLPFLKVTQELLAPYFEYMGNVQSSGYFKLKKAIPQDVLDMATDPKALPLDEQHRLIEQCADRVGFDQDRKYMVLLSKAVASIQHSGPEASRDVFEELKAQFPEQQKTDALYALRLAQASKLIENDIEKALEIAARRAAQ